MHLLTLRPPKMHRCPPLLWLHKQVQLSTLLTNLLPLLSLKPLLLYSKSTKFSSFLNSTTKDRQLLNFNNSYFNSHPICFPNQEFDSSSPGNSGFHCQETSICFTNYFSCHLYPFFNIYSSCSSQAIFYHIKDFHFQVVVCQQQAIKEVVTLLSAEFNEPYLHQPPSWHVLEKLPTLR